MNRKALRKVCGIWAENMEASLKTLEPRDYQVEAVNRINMGRLFFAVCGASRTGKSWILSGLANDLIDEIYEKETLEWHMDNDAINKVNRVVKYMTFFEFELMLRESQTKGEMFTLFNQLMLPNVLIIDEYGRGKWSDFTATFFQNLLIKRYGEKKRTLIGSNLKQVEFLEMMDLAIIERLGADNIVTLKMPKKE